MTGRAGINCIPKIQQMFVLRTRAYLEYGQLVDLFTFDNGLVTAVTRNSRRGKSPLKAMLQPFNLLTASLSGAGELMNISHVEIKNRYALGIYETFCGQYLNELLFYLMERNVPHPEVFNGYLYSLSYLTDYGMLGVEPVFRYFELSVLSQLGYGINFSIDSQGNRISEEERYFYDPATGFIPATGWTELTTYSGCDLKRLGAGELRDRSVLATAKKICRQAIDSHLGNHRIKSRELFSKYRAMMRRQ